MLTSKIPMIKGPGISVGFESRSTGSPLSALKGILVSQPELAQLVIGPINKDEKSAAAKPAMGDKAEEGRMSFLNRTPKMMPKLIATIVLLIVQMHLLSEFLFLAIFNSIVLLTKSSLAGNPMQTCL